MKFSVATDFEAPLQHAFTSFSDFEGFERYGLRAGAQIERVDDLTEPSRGMMWKIKTVYAGKVRKLDVELIDFEPYQHIEFIANSPGFEGLITIDLVSLSVNRTRANVSVDVKPTSISARLLIQSFRLTKSSLTKRFSARMDRFGAKIEDNYREISA